MLCDRFVNNCFWRRLALARWCRRLSRDRVIAMSRTADLYEKLTSSLAPSIWELADIKKGLLLQLFGGSTKDIGKQGKFRGEINVLLCGDPGTCA
jgi:DNA replication licensing factor MCM4